MGDWRIGVLLGYLHNSSPLHIPSLDIKAHHQQALYKVHLEVDIVDIRGAIVAYCDMQRRVAFRGSERVEIVAGTAVDILLAGLQIQAANRVKKGL